MARKLLWASLALAPATILLSYLADPGKVTLFALAAAALVPLAWLIGDATEHAAEHTGAGIGGFLNASFGNAAEHGGAVVIARRGKLQLATEIAASSSAQVALLVTPAVALLSWVVKPALPLTFRPIELAAMGGSALIVAFVLRDGRSRRWEGALLVGLYAVAAVGFLIAGDR